MEYDFDEIALKTGIAKTRIVDSVKTYEAMSRLFPKLELENQDIGLYGGTALNEIYYAKNQRLSYDIDLFCYSYKSTLETLSKLGTETIFDGRKDGNERAKLRLYGVEIDLWNAKRTLEKPAKRELTSLLYYFGYILPPIIVPSYSLEYLLAEKTIALADRNMLKDIYDLWLGLKLIKDKKKYFGYLNKLGEKMDMDVFAYVPTQIDFISKNVKYYEKEKIDVLYQPSIALMINEIKQQLEKF